MMQKNHSRRGFIGRIASVCTLAVVATLKTGSVFASNIVAGLSRITGDVIGRSNSRYEALRAAMVWYLHKNERYPDALVIAKSEQDVIAAVNFAREHNLKIAIRNTGHHITQAALRQGGLLLDLSALNQIEVDPQAMVAWVQPGVRSQPFMDALEKQGLAFPAAHTAEVGMGGYLLGGGIGWNIPQWDLACRSVLEVEIITANGQKVIASESENAELLWAARGAGPGFFGVVTRFKLKLFPLPKNIVKSTYIVPDSALRTTSRELDRLYQNRDERVEILAVLKHSADIPGMPEDGIACVVNYFAFVDTMDEAIGLLKPFAEGEIPKKALIKKENATISISETYEGQRMTDATSPFRTSVENFWSDEPVKAFHTLAERLRSTPSKRSFSITTWGLNIKKRDDTSVPFFADHYFTFDLLADEASHVEENYAWVAETVKATAPFTKGRYINETESRRHPEHIQQCFTPDGWARMVRLRRKYDPSGVFHSYLVSD